MADRFFPAADSRRCVALGGVLLALLLARCDGQLVTIKTIEFDALQLFLTKIGACVCVSRAPSPSVANCA